MEKTLDELTLDAANQLIERLDRRQMNWSMNAAIIGVFESPLLKPKCSSNQACHAGLSNLTSTKRVVSALMDGSGYAEGRGLAPEVELWFVDYILNRSPYAETFVTKNAKEALAYKYTVSSSDTPSNLMAAGMVALRRLWEYRRVAQAAYDLVQGGVNEDLAFLLGHLISCDTTPTPGSGATWGFCHSGHCSINPNMMGFKEVRRFMEHTPIKPNKSFYENSYYNSYDNLFGAVTDRRDSYHMFVRENFPYDQCVKPTSTSSVNPFTAALPKPVGNKSYAEIIRVMCIWANTVLMEKIKMLKVYIVNGGEAYARMFRDAGWATVDNPLEADLLQFTGGEDVTPALYGEERHRTTGNSARRDLNEAGYFAFAQRMGIPMAGICRGGQFLNVMSGGKMYQHVGAHATGRTHALFDLKDPMNPRKVVVSSTHHQMMRAGPDGQIIADANLGGFKQFMVGDKVAEGPEDEPDTEVVYYPTTKALCFQPHPEFFGPENECFKYYFECIERVHGLRA